MARYSFEELTQKSIPELDSIHAEGVPPSLDSLAGWEFRGFNVLNAVGKPVMWALSNLRFIKCFVRDEALGENRLRGYNLRVKNGTVKDPWTAIPNEEAPARNGEYMVYPKRENGSPALVAEHPNAVFLDYDIPQNNLFSGKTLDDYVVKPDSENDDLLLGKAYFELGPLRMPSFFILDRYQEHNR